MELRNNIFARLKLSQFRAGTASLVLLLATTVLLGWQFEIDFLKRPWPEFVVMNPLSAIAFLLGASAIFNLKNEKNLKLLAFSLLLISSIKLFSEISGLNIPIDTTLFGDKIHLHLDHGKPNRMATNTAIGFLLVAIALLLRAFKSPFNWAREFITSITLTQALLSLIGYGFKVPEFYSIFSNFPMTIPTAIGFILLTLAMLTSKPLGPFVTTVTSKGLGGFMIKLMFPLALVQPVLLGVLNLYGQREGLYSGEFGLMLVVAILILTFCLVIWGLATLINDKEAAQIRIELELEELNSHLEETVAERTAEAIRSRNMALEAAKRLTESESRFRALVENAGDAVIILAPSGKPTYVSESISRMLGYSTDEVMSITLTDVIHPDDLVGVRSVMASALKNPNIPVLGHSLRIKHTNGTWRWLEAIITNMVADETVNGIVVNFRDVSDRIEAEARLRSTETQFRKTLDNMLEGIQIIGFDWTYRYMNDAACAHGAKSREEILGKTMSEAFPGIEHSYLFSALTECMADRVHKHFDNEFTYPDGSTAWFELRIQPVPEGVFILSIDITDRKKSRAALDELNASLETTVQQRTAQLQASNDELQSFSYSVSHDLRAPLRAINGFSQMLAQQYIDQLDENGKRLLSIIQTNASNMGQLIDDLLEFSRTGRKELRKVDVHTHTLVQEVVAQQLTDASVIPTVNISMLPIAHCDPQLIKQVWINLISNAFKYSATVPQPTIAIWADVEETEVVFHVQDNGVGFDMQYADKLFGVFQRLHSSRDFEGTGVGLAIAYRIVTKHGGRIWVEAELGKGAHFHFALPLSKLNSTGNELESNTQNHGK